MLTKILLTLSLVTGIGTIAVANSDKYDAQQVNEIDSTSSKIVTQSPLPELENIAKAITVKVYAGEDRGSGILIAQKNNTYTIITNAHVTDRGDTYTIETSDGIKHNAVISDRQGTENDLAILEFNSNNAYQVAKLGDSKAIAKDETVIAAGFPYDRDNLLITQGKISLLLDKPLAKGYQIGFSNETVQGMSGGLLLNARGEVIGVLGKGKGALLEDSYNYQDGTSPTPESVEQMKNAGFSIPIANIAEVEPELASLLPGNNPDVTQNAQTEAAQKPEYTGIVGKVDAIAEQITVKIDNTQNNTNGSGVIVAKQGNTYYGLTAKHVVCQEPISKPVCEPNGTHQIVTPDGKTHKLNYQTVEANQAWLDIAIFSFESNNDYAVATIGKYEFNDQWIFISGFPKHNLGIDSKPTRLITGGKLKREEEEEFAVKDLSSLTKSRGNDGLVYTNISFRGMSGGAVLDAEGRLIGINTGSENEIYIDNEGDYGQLNLGLSLGENVSDFFSYLQANKPKLKESWLNIVTNLPRKISNVEKASVENQLLTVQQPKNDQDIVAWMNYGNQFWRYEKYIEAVRAFEKVIEIDSNFDKAFYGMGLAYIFQRKWKEASKVLAKATEVNPNPYYYWRWLGYSYHYSKYYDQALLAYDQAISKNQNNQNQDFVLYLEKGDVLLNAENYSKALISYDKAVAINPYHPYIYVNRCNVYSSLKKFDQAIADCNQAIKINSESAAAYINRGRAYYSLNKYNQAIADYSQAIDIEPQYVEAYNNRGVAYSVIKQFNKAFADYNQAIKINPEYAPVYNNRAATHRILEQFDEAVENYKKVISLNSQDIKETLKAHYFLGEIYQLQQKLNSAIEEYNLVLKVNPKDLFAIKRIGLIKYQTNAITEAKLQLLLALATVISSSAPAVDSAEIQLALAVTEYTLGNTESGLKFARTALQTDRNVANPEFLRKQLWGEKMITDSQKLLAEL